MWYMYGVKHRLDGPAVEWADGTKEWVNTRTGGVETLPKGIEPGWNYNPGKSREQALNADLAAKEQTMRQALSAPL